MIKIAVIGIAGESVFMSVDKFGKTGETSVALDYHNELGGKGFNQAIACARCGAKVLFLGAAYFNDVDRFTKTAKENAIDAVLVGKNEPSPYAVITTDSKGDNNVLVYRGAELLESDVETFREQIEKADVLLINNEVPISVNKKAVEIATQSKVKIILNPAPHREYDKEFLDKIYLFTPNEHEIKGLEDYTNVVVTLGSKGCYVKSLDRTIPAEKVEKVVDTTGAGDTFSGVLAVCIAEGKDIIVACEKASVASAIKVGRKYILNSIPSRLEIEKYLET